jgi:uncharacterized protein
MDTKQAVIKRRSNYDLTSQSTLSEQQLIDLLKLALLNAPSAFNSQSSRIVLALGKYHNQLWEVVFEEIKKVLDEETSINKSREKINKLKTSAGTILFYEDTMTLNNLKIKHPLYKNNVDIWSEQGQGMIQYMVWLLLTDPGMGVSLQHYNELIEKPLSHIWNVNPAWSLIGQMPFGIYHNVPEPKQKLTVETRLIIL